MEELAQRVAEKQRENHSRAEEVAKSASKIVLAQKLERLYGFKLCKYTREVIQCVLLGDVLLDLQLIFNETEQLFRVRSYTCRDLNSPAEGEDVKETKESDAGKNPLKPLSVKLDLLKRVVEPLYAGKKVTQGQLFHVLTQSAVQLKSLQYLSTTLEKISAWHSAKVELIAPRDSKEAAFVVLALSLRFHPYK